MTLLGLNKEDTSPSFRSTRFPKPQIFVEISKAQYGNAMLVHITRRPENGVNIWNLHWLSRRLTSYISTFPNALTSKKATNHEIGQWRPLPPLPPPLSLRSGSATVGNRPFYRYGGHLEFRGNYGMPRGQMRNN